MYLVCLLHASATRVLFYVLIIHTEEHYQVFVCVCVCLNVCKIDTSTTERLVRNWAVASEKKKTSTLHIYTHN